MLSPPATPRNAQPGNVQATLNSPGKRTKKRGQGQYKGRSPKAPAHSPRVLFVQHEGYFKVDLVALYVAVFDHDVLILDPSALYVPEGLGGPSYALLDGVLKARIRDSADLCHCSNAHIFLSHPLFRMLAHYYYCLHFAYHLKGEAKHIGSRPLNTPRQRPESPALVAKDRRRGDTLKRGYPYSRVLCAGSGR